MTVIRWLGALALGGATVLGGGLGSTHACTIDGVPSLTVNGFDVVINKVVPTSGVNLKLWAPFTLSFSLHAGRDEALAEIKNRVALRPEAFTTPWRWNFGDGTALVRGMSVHHTFRHPGVYKITVDAYFPSQKFWYTFDAAQFHVLPS